MTSRFIREQHGGGRDTYTSVPRPPLHRGLGQSVLHHEGEARNPVQIVVREVLVVPRSSLLEDFKKVLLDLLDRCPARVDLHTGVAETEVPPQDTIVIDQRLLDEFMCRFVERRLIEVLGAVANRKTNQVGVEVDVHPLSSGGSGILLPVTNDFELLATVDQGLEVLLLSSGIREDLAHVSDDLDVGHHLWQVLHYDAVARDVTSCGAIELHDLAAKRLDSLIVQVAVKLPEVIDTGDTTVERKTPGLLHGRSHLTFHLPHRANRSKPYNKTCCESLMNTQSET